MKNQRGFAWVPILLIVGLIVIVGGVSYYMGQQNTAVQQSPNYPSLPSAQSQQTNSAPVQATTNAAVQQPSSIQTSNAVNPSQQKPNTPSGPSATIDQSSLTSVGTPKLTGTVSGTSQITVGIWQGNVSPSEMIPANSKLECWGGNTEIRNPEVSVSNGQWSTSIGNSEVAGLGGPVPYCPNGTYTVSIADANTGKILTTGTLQITGPSIQVTQADASTVSFKYINLPANSQVLLAGQSNTPSAVATISGTGSSSYTIPGGMDGTYWLQVKLNDGSVLQSGPFSANFVGR